jgi:hypothetical protein
MRPSNQQNLLSPTHFLTCKGAGWLSCCTPPPKFYCTYNTDTLLLLHNTWYKSLQKPCLHVYRIQTLGIVPSGLQRKENAISSSVLPLVSGTHRHTKRRDPIHTAAYIANVPVEGGQCMRREIRSHQRQRKAGRMWDVPPLLQLNIRLAVIVTSHAVIQFARVATLPARLFILTGRICRKITAKTLSSR